MRDQSGLKRILSPIKTSSFYEEFYEKKPLLIARNTPGYFDDILSIRDVSSLLERKDIRYPAIRLVKEGEELAQKDYLKSYAFGKEVFDRVIDNDRLFTFFSQGATIVLQALHRTLPSLTEFCLNLENHFNYPVQTNIYLTPGTSQGFLPHFDNHDVFVLQVYGSKKWKIYDSPVYLPKRKFDRKKWEKTEPQIEAELQQGDTLYIPRGFVHEASTAHTASMHITVGLLGYTWMDVFKSIAEKSGKVKEFRETFNWKDLSDDQVKVTMTKLMQQLMNEVKPHDIRQEFSKRFIRKGMSSDRDRLSDIIASAEISPDTIFRLRKDISYEIEESDDAVKLYYYNKTISFPVYVVETLRSIIKMRKFSAGQLEGKLDEQGNLTLCRKLLTEGFLTFDHGT